MGYPAPKQLRSVTTCTLASAARYAPLQRQARPGRCTFRYRDYTV